MRLAATGRPAVGAPSVAVTTRAAARPDGLAVYADDAARLPRIVAALRGSDVGVATEDWSRFARAALRAGCLIVAVDRLEDGDLVRRIGAAKASVPLQPVILVARRDSANMRRLLDLRPDDVVWLDELEETLERAVLLARERALLRRLAVAFDTAAHLPLPTRHILAYACRTDPPVRSVSELAGLLGRDRRTLWRYWRKAFGQSPPVRLEDFLDWVLLVRAAARKPGRRWSTVAADIGVHEYTLRRLSRRLSGLTLHELGTVGACEVVARFRREALEPLLGSAARDILG